MPQHEITFPTMSTATVKVVTKELPRGVWAAYADGIDGPTYGAGEAAALAEVKEQMNLLCVWGCVDNEGHVQVFASEEAARLYYAEMVEDDGEDGESVWPIYPPTLEEVRRDFT